MAEGWAKHLVKNDLDIQSSGLEGSRVHPTAKVFHRTIVNTSALSSIQIRVDTHRYKLRDTLTARFLCRGAPFSPSEGGGLKSSTPRPKLDFE